jgi:4-hydroxy-4-methyl-2-oxoglutarate aldolase
MNIDVELLKKSLYSGILCDVMDGMGYRNQALSNEIMPLTDDTVVFGPAFTSIGTEVFSMPEDPLTAQCKVVDQLKEGEVYVLATRGAYNCAVFGELFATAVQCRKGVGVLLDGYARDLKALKNMDFPLFYRGRDPKTSKGRCEINECQIPIIIDGVTINPGDYIFADIDGVAVIPSEIADKVFEEGMVTISKENKVREGLLKGKSLYEVYTEIGAI